MSLQAHVWAWAQSEVTTNEKIILLALADRHNADTNECWPSNRRLAEDTRMSEASVKKITRSLCERGFISKEERRTPNGKHTSNLYRLHIPKNFAGRQSSKTDGATIDTPNPATIDTHMGSHYSPLESTSNNLPLEPKQNLTSEIDRKREFWDTALGTLAALNVAESTARGIIGRAIGITQGDFDAVQNILDSALINPPKNIASYVFGGLKKGAGSAPKIKMTPKMEEIEREYREKYKEYFDDTERSTGTDNRPVQPQPHAEPSNLSGASSGSPKVVSAGGSGETGGPARGYLDSLQVSADNSRSYRGGKEVDRKAV